MIPSKPFIELNRQFSTLPTDDLEQYATQEFYAGFMSSIGDNGWNELLKTRVVVVLGEPGSGKTREFRNQAEILRNQGQHAFFIELDRLISTPLSDALSIDERNRFQKWLKSDESGYFFLDSVDEAKLIRPNDYVSAINTFERGIESQKLKNVRLVISSRLTDWDHYQDAQEVLQRFVRDDRAELEGKHGSGDEGPSEESISENEDRTSEIEFRVAVMVPLDRKRVKTFVEAKLGVRGHEFIEQLDTNFAWEFTRRPLDVEELLSYWERNGRLGTLTELINSNLDQNLKPSERDRHDPLSPEEARSGAQCLAAASQFCRILTFSLPDAVESPGTIDPLLCLPEDWDQEKCRAILNRPLFEVPSVGRVRFHHRRYAEYLAAQWIIERLKNGYPTRELENLFFEEHNGGWIVRRGMRPVIAWLAPGDEPWNQLVRRRVLEADPGLFMSLGDPNALPIEYRRELLRGLVTHYSGREETWIDTDSESLSRLADPELAPDISELILDSDTPKGLKRELLLLVRHGKLDGCQDALIQVIDNEQESLDTKAYAIAAIRDMGDSSTRQHLASIVSTWDSMPGRIADHVCEALYPSTISALELVELFKKNTRSGFASTEFPFYLEYHFKAYLTPHHAVELLPELLNLLQESPRIMKGDKEAHVSEKFAWLIKILPAVITKALEMPEISNTDCLLLGEATWLFDRVKNMQFISSSYSEYLRKALLLNDQVRKAYIWQYINKIKIPKQDGLVRLLHLIGHDSILSVRNEDIDWLLEEVSTGSSLSERKQSLRFAVDVYYELNRNPVNRRKIKKVVSREPELKALFKHWVPPVKLQNIQWKAHRLVNYFKHRFKYDIRRVSEWYTSKRARMKEKNWMHKNLQGLRDGTEWKVLSNLARQAEHEGFRWGTSSWRSLNKKWGRKIAEAARDGWINSWQKYSPLLPHERPEPGVVNRRIAIGLSGISVALAERKLSLAEVTDEDTRLMTRYAINEMNGFPDWFVELSRKKPHPVAETLMECIMAEFDIPEDQQHVHEVLGSLKSSADDLAEIIGGSLMDELQCREPGNIFILGQVLSILTKIDNPLRAALAQVASKRSPSLEDNELRHIMWSALWLSSDAGPAIDYIEDYLNRTPNPDKWVEQLTGGLTGRSFNQLPELQNPDYLNAEHLERLIPLVFRYIRPEEDIRRSGVYTSENRDGAQQFRDWLLRALAENKDPQALRVLQQLIEEPMLTSHRDWISHLIEERAKTLAEREPWKPKDIIALMRGDEIEPKSDHDLFQMTCKRIKDIKNLVEQGEHSPREELSEEDLENKLRRWLGRRLRDTSNKLYVVPEEEEIDRSEKIDIRIETPGIPPVSIEIKWAQRWSGPVLKERLENQLVGQYMRDRDVKYGLYVLGREGTQERWDHPDGGSRLTFDELIGYLQGVADSIVLERDDIDGIIVFDIDFREPKK